MRLDQRADLTGRDPVTVRAGDLRDADQQFVSGPAHTEAGAVRGVAGRATVLHSGSHLCLIRIAQPQLDSRVRHGEQCLLLPDQPATGTGHQVNAVGKSPARNRDSPVTECVVLLVEIAEVVDHQKDVAEFVLRVGGTATRRAEPALPKRRDIQLVALERRLPGPDHLLDGRDDARDTLCVSHTDDSGDVRKVLHRVQRGPHTEEGHPGGPVHQRRGRDHRHQRGGLPALGRGDHHDVVHLDVDHVNSLLVLFGKVLDTDGEDQPGIVAVVHPPRSAAPLRDECISGRTDLQWGQPDCVRSPRRLGHQSVADDVDQLLALESVGVIKVFVGLDRIAAGGEGLLFIGAQRLVLPGQ